MAFRCLSHNPGSVLDFIHFRLAPSMLLYCGEEASPGSDFIRTVLTQDRENHPALSALFSCAAFFPRVENNVWLCHVDSFPQAVPEC
jgi:hypothetical protein